MRNSIHSINLLWGGIILLMPLSVVFASLPSVESVHIASHPVAQSGVQQHSSIHAVLDLKKEGHRLYADITVKAVSFPDIFQKVTIEWIPPRDSYCEKSQYTLFFNMSTAHLQSYRTFVHETGNHHIKICDGMWKVFVRDEQDNIVAEKTIFVESKI